jgi:pimeloyl-ACP methyl ester carboxylesterase
MHVESEQRRRATRLCRPATGGFVSSSKASPLTSAGAGAPASGDPVGNTTNLCEDPKKKPIPIIFVPGVMGSRLHFTDIDQAWDPDSNWAMIHWLRIGTDRARTEFRHTTPVEIMGKQDDLTDEEVAHGYGGLSKEFYVGFLRFLRPLVFNQKVRTPVYGIGYDWRQSNKDSGAYVTREVNRIMAHEGAGQVILISHSMGGMVTRSAMKGGLAGKVLGVIHIFQPVDGAVVLYRRFFTGAVKAIDGGFGLATILGNTGDKFCATSSGMPGPLQLLPTNFYHDTAGPWLSYKANGVHGLWPGDVFDLYNGLVCPPALMTYAAPHGFSAAGAADLHANVAISKAFHAELGHYQHPKTKTIHSSRLMTDMAIVFDPPTQPATVKTTVYGEFGAVDVDTTPDWSSKGAQRIARAEGDGTVPRPSANPLKPNVEIAAGVEHSAACGESAGEVREDVTKWIKEFLA